MYIDSFLKKEYNTDNLEEVARQGYRLLTGEKEARAVSERLNYDVSDRRRNFPDYERSTLTDKAYSDSGQGREALGEADLKTFFERNMSQDVGQRTETDTKFTKEYVQRNDRLDERRIFLGTDRIAGEEFAFSIGSRLTVDENLRRTSMYLYGEDGNRYLDNAGQRKTLISPLDEGFDKESKEKPKVRGQKKAETYQRQKVRDFDRTVKDALGINKYSDSKKIKSMTTDMAKTGGRNFDTGRSGCAV